MAKEAVFKGVISFFEEIGIYDVVLPFILVFAIVFAILEKTKVLGTEEGADGKRYTRKNINAIVAFVVSFIVVASSRLVSTINEAMGNIVILLLVSVSFLLLVGSFFKEEDIPTYLEGGWRILFMVVMFIGIVLIFLHAVKTEDGESWLEWFWEEHMTDWEASTAVGSIILLILVILAMVFAVKGGGGPTKASKKEEKE